MTSNEEGSPSPGSPNTSARGLGKQGSSRRHLKPASYAKRNQGNRSSLYDLPSFAPETNGADGISEMMRSENMSMSDPLPPQSVDDQKPTIRARVLQWLGLSNMHRDLEERVEARYDSKYSYWLNFVDKDDAKQFDQYCKNKIYPPVFWIFILLVGGIDVSRLSLSRMYEEGTWMQVSSTLSVLTFIVFFIFSLSHFSKLTGINELFWFENISKHITRIIFREQTEDLITVLFALAISSFLVARVLNGPCDDLQQHATAAIDCNPEAVALSPPTDTVLALYIHPLVLQLAIKGIRKHVMFFSWAIGTTTVTWSIIHGQGWLSIYSILQSLFFLLVIYETQRLKMLVFLQTKYELTIEKKRRQKAELENQLRGEMLEQDRLVKSVHEFEQVSRMARLKQLPIHTAIIKYSQETSRAMPQTHKNQCRGELYDTIKAHIDMHRERDFDGRTALTLLINMETTEVDAITMLLSLSLPIDPDTEELVAPEEHDYAWTRIVQYERYEPCVKQILKAFPSIGQELAKMEDPEGREAMHIASPKCKKAILSCIYFFRRYEIITLAQPHYQTKTSLVHLAIDHESDDLNKMVALKFLRHRDHFDREITARSTGNFNDEFVINTLRLHDSDADPSFREEILAKGITFFPYCLVMPVGERNLADVMVKEHIAGRDWAEIKVMMTQIACAVGHMHEKGFIHGDLKPLNIMRVAAKMKLIDLDSACECISGQTFAGLKYSSGFVPPEMVFCDETTACVRSESLLKGRDGDSSDRDSDDDLDQGFRRTESDFSVPASAMETPRSTSRIPPDYDHHPVLSRTPSSASHTPLSGPNGEEGSRSPVEQKDEKHASSSSSSGSIRLALEQIDEQKLLTPGKRTNSSLVLDSSSPSRDNLQNSNSSNHGKVSGSEQSTGETGGGTGGGGGTGHPQSPTRTRASDSLQGSGAGGGVDTSTHTVTNNSISDSRHGSNADIHNSSAHGLDRIRFPKRKKERKASLEFDLVPACPAHDLWSLGVVFYQIACNVPLFLCDGEGNIGDSDLRILAAWSDAIKAEKLSRIKNSLARNLLSIMLNKNPQRRPAIEVVLRHPFLSFHRTTRPEIIIMGEAMKQEFDVFISYRVATDLPHVELLHKLLQNAGLKVWWDKTSLEPGEPWDIAAFRGMLKSKIFIPLVSRGALQRMSALEKNTPCDNMYLEFVLALELRERGTLDKVFPLMLGDKDEAIGKYSKFTFRGANPCYPPSFPDLVVDSVDAKLRERLDDMELGMPIVDTMTVAEVLAGVMKFQGAYIEGVLEDSFNTIITSKIVPMCKKKKEVANIPSPMPAPASNPKPGLGLSTLLTQNLPGGGGIGSADISTPLGHSNNPSAKDGGLSDVYPQRPLNQSSDRLVVPGGSSSTRMSDKNEHGHSSRKAGNSIRVSFDGAEGSSIGSTSSPLYSEPLRTVTTPTNSDKHRNRSFLAATSSSEKKRLTMDTNPMSTSSLADEAEHLLFELSSLEGGEGGGGGHPDDEMGHILGSGKAALLGGATTHVVVDAALLSPAANGFGLGSSGGSSNRGATTRVPMFDERNNNNNNNNNDDNGANDASLSSASSSSGANATATDILAASTTADTSQGINGVSPGIPGLLLTKQLGGLLNGGPSVASAGSISMRGQLENQRNSNISSRNVNKAILGENAGGLAAFNRHNSMMGKALRPSDPLQSSGGGSGNSTIRVNSSHTSPRGGVVLGGAEDVGGVGVGSTAPRGSHSQIGVITNMHRKNSMMNAAMNAQHMAKLASGEDDDDMSSPRTNDLDEDVGTSLRPKPAALHQQIHARALSFMSNFDRSRRSLDAGGGGAPNGPTHNSNKETSTTADFDKDKDKDNHASVTSQKSNGSDKGAGTGREGAITLRNLFSSLLQQAPTPPQAAAAAATAAAAPTAAASGATPNPLAKARSLRVLAADGQTLDQLPRSTGPSTVRLQANKDNAAMQYQSVRLA